MSPWQGKRFISIVSACMSADGSPTFALNDVEVTHEEYQNGVHYQLVEDLLADARYEEPYVHFDEMEAPAFLRPAVSKFLETSANQTALVHEEDC